jgi:CRP-like cAMP-binding protein
METNPDAGARGVHVRGTNFLLRSLPQRDLDRLQLLMERVHFPQRTILATPGESFESVVFPLDSVVSQIVRMKDGSAAEVGLVGNEGVLGLPLYYGVNCSPNEAIVQLAGDAWRMPRHVFIEEIGREGAFATLIGRYGYVHSAIVSQSAACNALHPIEQRLCRWILMQQDRIGQDTLTLTQEFVAAMLGVQRSSVNLTARVLQHAGLIRYSRGKIDVLDRAGMETSCCECYGDMRRWFDAAFEAEFR